MRHDGNPTINQKLDGLSHTLATFELHSAAASFLHDPGGIAKGHLRALLIGAKGHIHHDQRAFCTGDNGLAVHDHQIQRHSKGAVHSMHDHAQTVTDQDKICVTIYNRGSMSVIAREADNGRATFAAADLRASDAFDGGLHAHELSFLGSITR